GPRGAACRAHPQAQPRRAVEPSAWLGRRVTLPEPPILVITDRKRARLSLEDVAEAVFAAGGRWLSLREKDLDSAARAALLTRLVALGRRYGATVGVHEDLAAAIAARTEAIHFPAGVSPERARRALGAAAI